MRYQRLGTALAAVILLGTGYVSAAKGPLIRLSERKIDFGRVEQYKQLLHDLTLRNEGDEPLVILKIDSDCGCTAAIPGDSVIQPGKEVILKVSFSTKTYKGPQTKTLILHTNDPAEPKATIKVHADVRPYVRLDRDRVRFPTIAPGETPSERIRVSADKGTNLKIVDVQGSEEIFTWDVAPAESAKEEAFWLKLTIRKDAPVGVFRRTLVIKMTGPPVDRTELTVIGTIQSYFVVEKDARIMLPTAAPGSTAEGTIRITCDGSKPYALMGIESSVPFLAGEILPDGANSYVLKITVKEDAPPGRFQELLEIKTNDPLQPTIEIRVRGQVRG